MKNGEKVFWFEISETPGTVTVCRFQGTIIDGVQSEFPLCKPNGDGAERKVYEGRIFPTYEESNQNLKIVLERGKIEAIHKFDEAIVEYCGSSDTD